MDKEIIKAIPQWVHNRIIYTLLIILFGIIGGFVIAGYNPLDIGGEIKKESENNMLLTTDLMQQAKINEESRQIQALVRLKHYHNLFMDEKLNGIKIPNGQYPILLELKAMHTDCIDILNGRFTIKHIFDVQPICTILEDSYSWVKNKGN